MDEFPISLNQFLRRLHLFLIRLRCYPTRFRQYPRVQGNLVYNFKITDFQGSQNRYYLWRIIRFSIITIGKSLWILIVLFLLERVVRH